MANKRWAIWIPLLIVTIVAAVRVSGDAGGDATVQPVRRVTSVEPRARVSAVRDPGGSTLARLAPREDSRDFGEIFSVPRSVVTRSTPKAMAPPAVDPPPPLPALPFKFMGRLEQDGQPALFLAWGERNLALRRGEVAEGTYRLESIGEGSAVFVHIPTGQQQTLSIGTK